MMHEKPKTYRSFGDFLQVKRTEQGISAITLADKIGKTYQCIYAYEHDIRLPSVEQLGKVADILKFNTNDVAELFPNLSFKIRRSRKKNGSKSESPQKDIKLRPECGDCINRFKHNCEVFYDPQRAPLVGNKCRAWQFYGGK